MVTNKDLIRMHLEEWLIVTEQDGAATWRDGLAFCLGYYGFIDTDIIDVIVDMTLDELLLEVK